MRKTGSSTWLVTKYVMYLVMLQAVSYTHLLDETFFSMLPMSAAEINEVKTDGLNFGNWNHTKVQALSLIHI